MGYPYSWKRPCINSRIPKEGNGNGIVHYSYNGSFFLGSPGETHSPAVLGGPLGWTKSPFLGGWSCTLHLTFDIICGEASCYSVLHFWEKWEKHCKWWTLQIISRFEIQWISCLYTIAYIQGIKVASMEWIHEWVVIIHVLVLWLRKSLGQHRRWYNPIVEWLTPPAMLMNKLSMVIGKSCPSEVHMPFVPQKKNYEHTAPPNATRNQAWFDLKRSPLCFAEDLHPRCQPI